MKQTIAISVRDLVAYTLRSGDLTFEFAAAGRPVEAIRAHQRIQRSRGDDYIAEVPVVYRHETPRFILTISGRIDGVAPGETGTAVLEEIKTTTKDLADVEASPRPEHWGQLKTYACMYARNNALDEIHCRLTYAHLDTGETLELKQRHTLAELNDFFDAMVSDYLRWAEALADWFPVRDESLQQFAFPFATYRKGQRELAVQVYQAIREEGRLIVQAATGIGKTMAVLFPALKAMGQGLTEKIFYLTARNTARMAAEDALERLRGCGLRVKSLTLTAKEKICFSPGSACSPEECDFARGHFDRLNDAVSHLFQKDAFTREAVEDVARTDRVCPFEFALEMALWSDVIIGDYNYAFDPRVHLKRFFAETGGNYTFLVDEAHNLVDRSREMFSAAISKQPFLDVRRPMKTELPRIHRQMGKVSAWLGQARKAFPAAQTVQSTVAAPSDLFPLLRQFLRGAEKWLAKNHPAPFREELLQLYFDVGRFVRVADQYDENYATICERSGRDLAVRLFCINPAPFLRAALERCRTAVFFSATMTPHHYFADLFGCGADARRISVPSPFPPEHLGVFVSDRTSTYFRDREKTAADIVDYLQALVVGGKGNYLVFFPSYAYLQLVCALFCDEAPQVEVIVQRPEMTETERAAFLDRFDRENPQTLLGFAVMGGIFGEGIDLVGERLNGAVIVGVGLPGISAENELIREHFQAADEAGFEYAYQFPGLNRVLQAAGRVIRSETDRGIVVLIDRRYGAGRYAQLLPREWRRVSVRTPASLSVALENFRSRGNTGRRVP